MVAIFVLANRTTEQPDHVSNRKKHKAYSYFKEQALSACQFIKALEYWNWDGEFKEAKGLNKESVVKLQYLCSV